MGEGVETRQAGDVGRERAMMDRSRNKRGEVLCIYADMEL